MTSLWTAGDVRGLYVALGFGAALNLALIDTMIWPQLLELGPPVLLWGLVATYWLAGIYAAFREGNTATDDGSNSADAGDGLFIQAQTEYLSGDWDEAAWRLQRILAQQPRDVEARLLLATLCRHQRQFDAAREQLQILQRFDESTPWSFEIQRELELLAQFAEYDQQPAAGCEEHTAISPTTPDPEESKREPPAESLAATDQRRAA